MNEYEVNLTPLLGLDLWPLAGANVTHGENADARAWVTAKTAANGLEILTEEQAARFCTMMQTSGVDLDADAPKNEIVALFLQVVTNDLREIGLYEVADLLEIDGEVDEGNFFVVDGVPYFQIS